MSDTKHSLYGLNSAYKKKYKEAFRHRDIRPSYYQKMHDALIREVHNVLKVSRELKISHRRGGREQ